MGKIDSRPREIYPGIFRITLPLFGGKPGPVNVYLLTGGTVTLIDTGTAATAGILEKSLAAAGFGFGDIDRIVLTHGHLDHCGAAKIIQRKSGRKIEILAHREDLPLVERGMEVSRLRMYRFLKILGVPLWLRVMLGSLPLIFRFLSRRCAVDRCIDEGDLLEMGSRTGRVIHTPGHTKGSVCLYLESEGILFPGDHIIAHITPNAFIMMDPSSLIPSRRSQEEYYRSLKLVEELAPRRVLPAHGREIGSLEETLDMYRRSFAERQARVLDAVRGGGDSVYRIARKLFPGLSGFRLPLELYLSVSEVYTHIQILERDGAVETDITTGRLAARALNCV